MSKAKILCLVGGMDRKKIYFLLFGLTTQTALTQQRDLPVWGMVCDYRDMNIFVYTVKTCTLEFIERVGHCINKERSKVVQLPVQISGTRSSTTEHLESWLILPVVLSVIHTNTHADTVTVRCPGDKNQSRARGIFSTPVLLTWWQTTTFICSFDAKLQRTDSNGSRPPYDSAYEMHSR